MDDLVRRAVAVDQANLALGHEVFQTDDATFVRNRALPQLYDANHVRDVRAATPAAIERLLARVEVEYAASAHRQFLIDDRAPPEFAARLVLDGYACSASLVMLLDGPLAGRAPLHPIRAPRGSADWDAFAALMRLDWHERATRIGVPPGVEVAAMLTRAYRLKTPPLRYWLAVAEGAPVGFFSSWEGTERVGQVENLFVHADHRHRGIGTALIHHAVADARAHGAGPVAIVADADDTPKRMYAALGFRPVAVLRKYLLTGAVALSARPGAPSGSHGSRAGRPSPG